MILNSFLLHKEYSVTVRAHITTCVTNEWNYKRHSIMFRNTWDIAVKHAAVMWQMSSVANEFYKILQME